MLYTCIVSNGQQGAKTVWLNRSPFKLTSISHLTFDLSKQFSGECLGSVASFLSDDCNKMISSSGQVTVTESAVSLCLAVRCLLIISGFKRLIENNPRVLHISFPVRWTGKKPKRCLIWAVMLSGTIIRYCLFWVKLKKVIGRAYRPTGIRPNVGPKEIALFDRVLVEWLEPLNI